MSDQDQISSLHSVNGDATINYDSPGVEGQGGLLNNLFPSSRAFVEIDVDSVIESIELCRQRLMENAEAMKVLYHQRQCMMERPHVENLASLPVPNGGAFNLPFTELGFGGSEIDAFQYRLPEGLDMDISRQADTLDAAGPLVYASMKVVSQQQALAALSRNTQTEIGDEGIPRRELAGYHDKRTASFAPVYTPFPESTYDHAQKIAFGSASSCLPGQTISPAALVDTSDIKDATSSVAAPPRDRPTVLSFISGGVKHYRCECGYESARKGDVHHHLESLRHSERRYECSCGKKFTRYDSLDRHRKRCKIKGIRGITLGS